MTMDIYFSRLLAEKTGAEDLILVCDHASLQRQHHRMMEKTRERKPVLQSMSRGPPNCPMRKASQDNLNDLDDLGTTVRNKRGSLRKTKDSSLNNFFDEVAPGLRSRQKTKNKVTTVSPSTVKRKTSDLKNNGSLLKSVFGGVTNSRDDMFQDVPTHDKIEKMITKKDLEDVLGEVEDVVSQFVPTRGATMTARDARWMEYKHTNSL
jgi:hypothetical protein